MTAKITKRGRMWSIDGVIGMTEAEFESVAKQILSMPELRGDTVLVFQTRQGIERWSVADFSNDSSRGCLYQKIQ